MNKERITSSVVIFIAVVIAGSSLAWGMGNEKRIVALESRLNTLSGKVETVDSRVTIIEGKDYQEQVYVKMQNGEKITLDQVILSALIQTGQIKNNE